MRNTIVALIVVFTFVSLGAQDRKLDASMVHQAGDVELNVYNILGQKVKTLENSDLAAGDHEFVWNGEDDNGDACGSGVYFCRIKTSKSREVRKLLLLK